MKDMVSLINQQLKVKMDRSAAVGVGQFLRPEQDLKNYLDMDPETTLFTEENQIKLIIAMKTKKRGIISINLLPLKI